MDKIKKIIIGFSIIIVILILILLLITSEKDNSTENSNNIKNESQNTESNKTKLSNLENNIPLEVGYIDYYTVSNCITNYLNMVNISNASYYSRSEDGSFRQTISREEIRNRAKSIVQGDNIELLEKKVIFIPIQIEKATANQVNSYKVYGVLSLQDMQYVSDMFYIVNLDTVNNTFSIEPLNGNYNNLNEIQVENIEQIEKNDYNQFEYQELTDEYKYKQIFNNMKGLLLAKPEIIYERLEETYKAKRFGSYQEFLNYTRENREQLIGITPDKYKVNDENTQIIIQDQHKNRYKFYIEKPMQYTVRLDNYIVLNEDDIKYYSSLSGEQKVEYNLDRVQKMLKNKDYKFIYEYLDDTFKEENYPSVNDFINFINQELDGDYEIVSKEITKDGNIYEIEVEVANTKKAYSQKYFNVVMRLDNETDFTMSFSKE